jgi:hypothetical protein
VIAATACSFPLVSLVDEESTLFPVLLLSLLGLFFAAVLTAATTFVFNRPKLLVPAPRRNDPSLLSEVAA